MLAHLLTTATKATHGQVPFTEIGGFSFAPSDYIPIAFAVLFSAVFLSSLVWVFLDARSRQRSGLIAVVFIMLTGWPFSFVWWLWLRPPLRDRRR